MPVPVASRKSTAVVSIDKAPTVDELIASYHKAIGGIEANRKLKTRRIEGTVEFVGAPQPFKLTLIHKVPDLILTKVEIPDFGVALRAHVLPMPALVSMRIKSNSSSILINA